jgi:hypothetical protein
MMKSPIIRRQLRDGRWLEVRGREEEGRWYAVAAIDGSEVASSSWAPLDEISDAQAARLPAEFAGGYRIGPVALTRAEGDKVRAAEVAARAAWEASPAGQRAALVAERRALASRLAGAREAAAFHAERAWERGDEAAGVARARDDAAVRAARAALMAFDAAHPEVVAALEAERAERAERSAWN